MARKPASRKWQITINNPLEKDYSHCNIKEILSQFANCIYWCMADEIGTEGTYHTHIYMVCRNAVMFDTVKERFIGAHFESANGTNQQNRDYIRKEGKWAEEEKHETNLTNTFEEFGELPADRRTTSSNEEIYELIKDGLSNTEIMELCPSAFSKIDRIEKARQEILSEEYKNTFRKLTVTYIWGKTETGKTRSVLEKYGYSKVYRVTDYDHPFDSYKGQKVIMFEEFRSSLRIEEMLNLLDGYPYELPCRYANKVACYDTVYITTNISLEEQYPLTQLNHPETWEAFKRRIHSVEYKSITEEIIPFWEVLNDETHE